jgi:predicted PurR-regulated permease PerM|tara:strand:+ start:2306 stop:2575 length:270 start_codon:yes stop_codon:yes gene_type:complete
MIGKIVSGFLFTFIIVIGFSIATVQHEKIQKLDRDLTRLENKFQNINRIQNEIISIIDNLTFIVKSIEEEIYIIEEDNTSIEINPEQDL